MVFNTSSLYHVTQLQMVSLKDLHKPWSELSSPLNAHSLSSDAVVFCCRIETHRMRQQRWVLPRRISNVKMKTNPTFLCYNLLLCTDCLSLSLMSYRTPPPHVTCCEWRVKISSWAEKQYKCTCNSPWSPIFSLLVVIQNSMVHNICHVIIITTWNQTDNRNSSPSPPLHRLQQRTHH